MKIKEILSVCIALFMGASLSAQTYKYIGADKCRPCHNRPESGEQYNKWLKDPHSQSLKALASQASLDYAKKKGIADPTKEASCLRCHSTYDAAGKDLSVTILANEGVSCESCHGPGSAYKAIPIMRNHELSLKNGLIEPTKEVCISCHNPENPFHKEFNYEASLSKISHPILSKGKH